jgi:hypothetical protein
MRAERALPCGPRFRLRRSHGARVSAIRLQSLTRTAATNFRAILPRLRGSVPFTSYRLTLTPGDMPANATFIFKPFSTDLVHDHPLKLLPGAKKSQPFKAAI